MLGLLRRFPGYTLSALLDEDAELIQLLKIEELGAPEGAGVDDRGQ